MADPAWFFTEAGVERGPWKLAQMRAMVVQGRITVVTPVRRADRGEVLLAGDHDELMPAKPAQPVVPIPRAEVPPDQASTDALFDPSVLDDSADDAPATAPPRAAPVACVSAPARPSAPAPAPPVPMPVIRTMTSEPLPPPRPAPAPYRPERLPTPEQLRTPVPFQDPGPLPAVEELFDSTTAARTPLRLLPATLVVAAEAPPPRPAAPTEPIAAPPPASRAPWARLTPGDRRLLLGSFAVAAVLGVAIITSVAVAARQRSPRVPPALRPYQGAGVTLAAETIREGPGMPTPGAEALAIRANFHYRAEEEGVVGVFTNRGGTTLHHLAITCIDPSDSDTLTVEVGDLAPGAATVVDGGNGWRFGRGQMVVFDADGHDEASLDLP
jgi:hypothetical protein